MISQEYLHRFIADALKEDVGDGDHSANCSIPEEATGKMKLLVKEAGILAGIPVAVAVFNQIDPDIRFTPLLKDGNNINPGDIAFKVEGSVRSLLLGERLVLNLLQRMSGIATKTDKLVKIIEDTGVKLLDTRKTTPNLRPFEKYAVTVGGGYNHRMGLYDMIMLKDNHIDFAGGITPAIKKARRYLEENNLSIPIEIETRNFKELNEVLVNEGVKRVMFDNFSPEDTRKAVTLVNGQLETESSGGITEKTIRDYAETGVDFISVGALTHSVKSLDLSLKAI